MDLGYNLKGVWAGFGPQMWGKKEESTTLRFFSLSGGRKELWELYGED